MDTTNHLKNSASPAAELASYSSGSVRSKDGTTIGYRQLGDGPAIILVHGAMESAASHMQLASALAGAFTVYAIDRRGRGLSGPYGKAYSIQEDVEDMDAMLSKTGAQSIFGVSSGGLICLQAALQLPAVHKVAVYEPAFFQNPAIPAAFLKRYDQEMAQGKLAAAMITGMKGAQMGPPIFNVMPRWLLERMTASAMKSEDEKAAPGAMTMSRFAPTLHYDFRIVTDLSGSVQRFGAIQAAVLLLGGSQSPAYLKAGLDDLVKLLPQAERIKFPGLNHSGSSDVSNFNRTGRPEVVARELLRFFA